MPLRRGCSSVLHRRPIQHGQPLTATEILEQALGSGFSLSGVLFQPLDQTADQRSACRICSHPDRDIDRIQASVQDIDMRAERSRNAQSGYVDSLIGIAAGCWNKDGLDHLNFLERMAFALLTGRALNQMRLGLELP
jgi:hypothetical protein